MVALVKLSLTGPMDHLRLVWQAGEAMLECLQFDGDSEATRYHILVALQELVTNVLRHGYRSDDGRPIEVVFAVDAAGVEITLRDQGPAFDPLAHVCSHLDAEQLPETEGGYGIHIVRMVMDEVSYRRTEGWNELRMRKACRTTEGQPH